MDNYILGPTVDERKNPNGFLYTYLYIYTHTHARVCMCMFERFGFYGRTILIILLTSILNEPN